MTHMMTFGLGPLGILAEAAARSGLSPEEVSNLHPFALAALLKRCYATKTFRPRGSSQTLAPGFGDRPGRRTQNNAAPVQKLDFLGVKITQIASRRLNLERYRTFR